MCVFFIASNYYHYILSGILIVALVSILSLDRHSRFFLLKPTQRKCDWYFNWKFKYFYSSKCWKKCTSPMNDSDLKMRCQNYYKKPIALTCAYLYNPNLNRIFKKQIHTNYYYNTLWHANVCICLCQCVRLSNVYRGPEKEHFYRSI